MVQVDERLKHIAFIMDGNGRWAQRQGKPREYGHRFGVETLETVNRYCQKIGLQVVTVYAFSTENWKRPKREVDTIMMLLDQYITKMTRNLKKDQVCYRFIGNLSVLSPKLQERIRHLEELSSQYSLIVNIALNYGGREEIVQCCNRLIAEGKTEITEADISRTLYTAHCCEPDLIVRTGGELRLSNFLMWQSAYSELYFTDVLWPDFSTDDVDAAITAFYSRKRRYGGVVTDADESK